MNNLAGKEIKLAGKLRKALVHKFIGGSEYPTYRYVRVNMEENDYSFGTEKEDLVFDGRASVVIDAVVTWVNSKVVRKC